jgi:hypothetical protein
LILQPIGSAALLHVIAQEFIDQPSSIGAAFAFALRRFGSLLGTSILAGLTIAVGFVLCCVPGIMFAIWYAFAAQVVVVEGLGGTAAMERSKALTTGYRWQLFGFFAMTFLLSMGVGMLGAVLERILPSMEMVAGPSGLPQQVLVSYRNHAIHVVFLSLLSILVQTYMAICITLYYFDLRIRKEGFDLELAARQQSSVVS